MAIHSVDNKTEGVQDQMQQIREGLGTTSISPVIEGQEQGYVTTKNAQILANDGTYNRVAIGQRSDGTYGIKVSKPGYDALTAADTNLNMSSDFNNLKVYMTGSVTLTPTAYGSAGRATTTVTTNLGYYPIIVGSVLLPAAYSNDTVGFPLQYAGWSGTTCDIITTVDYFAQPNSFDIVATSSFDINNPITVKYYVLVESGT